MSRFTPSLETLRAVVLRVPRKLRGLLISSMEMVLAVAIVLVFALGFMGILVMSFPKGTGLVDFYEEMVNRDEQDSELEWQVRKGDDSAHVAVLTEVRRNVRSRSAEAVSWSEAQPGTRLMDHHTIQTMARSAASITIGADNELRLGERSLLVVKRENRRRGLGRRRSSVVLLGGTLEGRVSGGRGKTSRLVIVTAAGTSELRSRGDGETEFSVAVNPDDSSTIAILAGTAKIKTAEGSMQVGPNEAVTLDPMGFRGQAEPIPDRPKLLSPPNGAVRTFGAISPRIRFQWAAGEGVDRYRFVLARNRDLTDVVYQGELNRPEFIHGDLPGGRYYWRVRALSGHVASQPSAVRSLQLTQDIDPPELHVELPQEVVAVEELIVRGTVEPGSELFIKNQSVPLNKSGAFEYALKLNRGLNMIVIEAVDAAGNSAYRSQYVTARF